MSAKHDPLCNLYGLTCEVDEPDDPLCWLNCTPCDCELIAKVRADERAKRGDRTDLDRPRDTQDGWPESSPHVGPRVVRRNAEGIRWEWDDDAKWHSAPHFVDVYRAKDGSLCLECGQDEHEMGGFVELTREVALGIASELIRLASDTPTHGA